MSVTKNPYYDTWISRYYKDDGSRSTKSFKTEAEALKFDAEMEARRKLLKKGQLPAQELTSDCTLMQAVESYFLEAEGRGMSQQTIKDMKGACNKHFYEFFGPNARLSSITLNGPNGVYAFMRHMRNRENTRRVNGRYTEATINRTCEMLRAICNHAVRANLIPRSPMLGWKGAKEAPRQFEITPEDVLNIYNHAAPHLQRAIMLAWNTGVRTGPSELFSLRWTDVNWVTKTLHVYAQKTDKHRYIPLTDKFLAELAKWKNEARTEYILEYLGHPVTRMNKSFQRAVARAGVKCNVRFYDLRKMFGSYISGLGADPKAVQELLGHSSIEMTMNYYCQPLPEAMRRAVTLMPDLQGNTASSW